MQTPRSSEIESRNKTLMREAIRLSLIKMRQGSGGPFGAVVTRNGRIVGRGWNQVASTCDPTAHAEVVAIRAACRYLRTFRLDGCEIYASCEPCPMCLAAIYWARIPVVFYGNTRRDAANIAFDDSLLYRELALPIRRRQVRMKRLLAQEAITAFAEWRVKKDKVLY